MIGNYFKIAWRHILKNKVFSAINIGGLTIGLTSCLLLLIYINYEWGYDKQFRNVGNIYTIENNQEGDGEIFTFMATPEPLAQTIQNEVPGVKNTVRVTYPSQELLNFGEKSIKKLGIYADPSFFSVFSYNFLRGNATSSLADPNDVVITKKLAHTLFGSQDPMNQIITYKNQARLKVTGVIENPPANSSIQFDYVLPWTLYETENPWVKNAGWGSNFCATYVELSSKEHFGEADALIRKMINSHQDEYKGEAFLFPFAKQQLYSKFENGKSVGGAIDELKLFFWLAVGILLIACINFMNLSTARSQKKALEVGVRKTLGSSRSALLKQFICESLLISAIAMVLALLLTSISMPYFNRLLELQLQIPYTSWEFWAFILFLVLFTGFTAGSYPAFYLSSFKPISVIKGPKLQEKSLFSLRRVMVILQFGFSVSLIVATICIYRQINFIQNKPIGYNPNNLVEVTVEGELAKHLDAFQNEVKNSGAAVATSKLGQHITSGGYNGWGVDWPGKNPNAKVLFDFFSVGYHFKETVSVKMVEGRDFSEQFPADTTGANVLINKTAAKLMKAGVGDQIKVGDDQETIVGVFDDFVKNSPFRKVPPMVVGFLSDQASVVAMKLNPEKNISSSVNSITKILKEINPSYPADIQFVDKNFEKKFHNERLLGTLSILFNGICILISCLGLFGLSAFSAQVRIKEIGVQKGTWRKSRADRVVIIQRIYCTGGYLFPNRLPTFLAGHGKMASKL